MNRVLLLLLSALTINLFGKVISPDLEKKETPPDRSYYKEQRFLDRTTGWSGNEKRVGISPMMDTIPPIIHCPSIDTIILLTQGRCDTMLNYTVTATDDQGPAIVIQLSGLASGSTFPLGSSACVFLATDLSGNTSTCSFSITVDDAGVSSLSCNDLDTVYLGINCTGTLLPQNFLEDGPYGCWNRYISEVDLTMPFGNGPWIPATFDADDIGKTYQARITDTETGNKCWGNVRILDKLAPVLSCQDFFVSCAEDNLNPNYLKDSLGIAAAMPQVNDACGPINFLGHVDSDDNFDCDTPFTKIVHRQWQATDQSGNSSTCIQNIKLHRHTLDEIQLPPDVTLNCPDTNITPFFTGQPFVMFQGKRYEMASNSICDISAFYAQDELKLPCGDRRVRRLWELFDFCTGDTDGPFLQNIYVLDQSGPSVACPGPILVTVNADTCHGLVDLPDVVLDDVCSQLVSIQAFWLKDGLSTNLSGTLGGFPGNDPLDFDTLGVMGLAVFPIGSTLISYVAEDSCGNIGDCTFNLTVADMVPPVAQCDTFSTLLLSDDGTLTISASSLDNGSADNCTPISFKARLLENTSCLNDTVWTDSLWFCCLNLNDTLNAVLRVYDIPVPNGIVTASYGSGHFSDCALKIHITDPQPPTCIAPANVTVSCENFDPTLDAYGIFFTTSCRVDSISKEADFSQFDTVCNRGTIVRIFNVFDDAGNSGACAQAVTVNYKQDYFIKFPNDMIVTVCDGTNNFGDPEFFGVDCESFNTTYTDEVFTIVPDACFKIERTWTIFNWCTFNPNLGFISVPNPNPNPITNHSTNLPGPTVSACGTLPPWAPTEVKINPSDPQPTNFCTFWQQNANSYQYKQIIKVIDVQAPTGTYTPPVCGNQNWATNNNTQLWNENYWWDNNLQTSNLSEEPTELSIVATDACSGANVNIEYLLFLDLEGDGVTETVINSVNVGIGGLGWNNVYYNNLNTPNYSGGTQRAFDERPVPANQKMGWAIQETVTGNTKTAKVAWNTQQQQNTFLTPELPHGTHKIKWFITDQCGNNKEYEYTFTVKDCKAPTVACQSGLNVNILPTAQITLFASDILQYTEDNCTPLQQILIGVRKCGTGTGFPVDGNSNPVTKVTFTCAELGTQCVELWAIDKAGNSGSCVANINVNNNQGNCPDPGDSLRGRIITEAGVGISDVSILIEGTSNFAPPFSYWYQNQTNSQGYYAIGNNLPMAANFSITPERDDNPLNGTTTYDLVLISKHILGLEPLNTPYKLISADANKSGSVTSFDIVEIRKLILGIYTDLPNNTSWRFVDSSFVFPNPTNPFQTSFPDTIPFTHQPPYNFIGMKIGDVNLSAIPNFMAPAEDRFAGTIYFDVEDRTVQEGEVLELDFNASERMEGCQFTLETDGLEVLEILPGENMGKDNFALFPNKSLITMSWEAGGQASFSIRVKAYKAGMLREMLRISSEITKAEGYALAQAKAGIDHSAVGNYISNLKSRLALRFGHSAPAFELFQNQPNPFAHKTEISFNLPEASNAVLTVLDGMGKVVWSKTAYWPSGMSTVEVDLAGLSAAGILYYKLETPDRSAVQKMVRL